MSNLSKNSNNSENPFDAIRHEDEQGEYWLARELMPLLGYSRWDRVPDVIDRAKASCSNSGNAVCEHFSEEARKSGGRNAQDFKLSRLACYLTAMNGDPRKPEIASAQNYFAIKTREAEVVIPAQDAELEKLRIQLGIAEANAATTANQLKLLEKTENLAHFVGVPLTLALLGRGDELVEIEKPTLEVIDEKSKAHFKGQTLKQVAEYVNKRYGRGIKNGASVKRILEQENKAGLIAQVPRSILTDYIPAENLLEVYKILDSGDRQLFIGE